MHFFGQFKDHNLGRKHGNWNPGQNIWNKIEKSSKTEQVKKSLISPFACFLTAITKVLFLEERLDTMSPPKFEIFFIFPYFLRS